MPLALTGYEWGLLLTALVFIVFALVVALVVPRTRPTFPSRYLGWFIAACIVLFVGQMTAVLLLAELGEGEHAAEAAPGGPGEEETETEPGETETEPGETEPPATTEPEPTEPGTTEPPPGADQGDVAAGKELFTPNCAQCHTLADAGTTGTVGPNLDESRPSYELAVDRITNGAGVMPPFGDTLTNEQIQDVAAYVSTAAGGG